MAYAVCYLTHRLFCFILTSIELCDMLLQGQKSILQSGAQRFQKQVFAILQHSLVFGLICCTSAMITTGNNKLKIRYTLYNNFLIKRCKH